MSDRTNILLITSDQQHWFTLGVLNPEVQTPNLDRMAKEGMLCNRAYCPNPTCTPTRSSIITGKYPSQHGAYSLGTKLPESEHVVGEDFQKAGYRTALVGKAHFQQTNDTEEYPSIESRPYYRNLDYWRNFHGPFYGFEHIEIARNHTDEQSVGQHYGIWMKENGLTNWTDYYRPDNGNPLYHWDLPEKFHQGTWIAERSCALLEQYAENAENFFLWSSFFDPHPKYLVSEPWDTMYDPDELTLPQGQEGEHDKNPPHFQLTQEQKPDFSAWQEEEWGLHGFRSHLKPEENKKKDMAVYYGMISLMDKQIGQILDKLDDLGLTENTLVVFTSDHGHYFGQHNLTAKGAFHYEDGIRVPFLVRQPGKVPVGVKSEAIQSLVDLAPSFLIAVGLDIPRSMVGMDQTPVWYGEADEARDHAVVEFHHAPTTVHVKTYVGQRYKLTTYYNRDYGELFDLEEDPGEFNNLWDEEDAKDLKTDLIHKLLFAEMGKEPLWMPRISGA